ncbi:MAG: hypothetical protein OEZ13_00345 [Spirochaetia bacterium]|nr:hypothetical protein [Spirochaetia bacterium]
MSVLNKHQKLALISIIVRKGFAEKVISQVQAAGGLFGIIVKARGSMRQGKKGWFKPLSISPEMESMLILTTKETAENVLQKSILVTEINKRAIGAVKSIPLSKAWTTEYLSTNHKEFEVVEKSAQVKPQVNLSLITCVCQRGKADEIAAAAVREGAAAPIIHFGEGKGVRDRMGLLKIAVNPEKEIIDVVVDEMECDRIFNVMVEAGRLFAPGMGFIYTTKVPTGFINLHTTVSSSHTEATTEQIVKAIDELKESKSWRMADIGLASVRQFKRKQKSDLINLKLITRRGLGDEFINTAMHTGAHGATRVYGNLIGGEKLKSITGRMINDEREVIDFHVTPEVVDDLFMAFDKILTVHESKNSFVLEIPVPRAVTYFG